MPTAALRPCSYPGCPELVKSGRCVKHMQEFKRDPERQSLYDRKWQARRRLWLAQHPWCEECLKQNIYEQAIDVHHLERHEGDKDKFMNSPLQSLCKSCHSRRTAEETYGHNKQG